MVHPVHFSRRSEVPTMLRTSSYTIFVNLPDNENEVVLVHGYTGA